jgi:Sec-independent protein secretion pathway component TatC
MRFVTEWPTVLWRAASNWVTLIVNTVIAHALVFFAILPFAPFYLQLPLALFIALVASSPTWLARVIEQPKMAAKVEEKQEARDGN